MQQTRTVEAGTGLFVLLGIGALFFLEVHLVGFGRVAVGPEARDLLRDTFEAFNAVCYAIGAGRQHRINCHVCTT